MCVCGGGGGGGEGVYTVMHPLRSACLFSGSLAAHEVDGHAGFAGEI